MVEWFIVEIWRFIDFVDRRFMILRLVCVGFAWDGPVTMNVLFIFVYKVTRFTYFNSVAFESMLQSFKFKVETV